MSVCSLRHALGASSAQLDNLCADVALQIAVHHAYRIGLKLFEPKTMCPLIAVRDCEER